MYSAGKGLIILIVVMLFAVFQIYSLERSGKLEIFFGVEETM